MAEYKALVVDFGGVLTTPLQDAMAAFAEEMDIELQDLVRIALAAYAGEEDNLVVQFETGQIEEEEFAAAFAQRLTDVTGKEVAPENLVRRLLGGLALEEPMLDAVARARAHGLKTGLLSNSWGVDYYPRDRLDGLFDVMVISGEVGLRKPDRAIFEVTLDRLGLAGEECVFVDDHPGHLKAALEVGMTTILHRSPAETITELESTLGIALS